MGKDTIPLHTIREPIVDGIFYPENGNELRKKVETLLSQEFDTADYTGADAIISPHAGYDYCGEVMGSAFQSAANGKVETVVLLGPVHRERKDEIYLTESHYFRTPLGTIPVDISFIDEIDGFSSKIMKNDIPHLEEHCLEIQLPFIQYLYPEASIVPILMGTCSVTTTEKLVQALQFVENSRGNNTLFISSVNMSAYEKKADAERGTELLLSLIEKKDWRDVITAADKREINCCGAACVACLLAIMGKNVHIKREKMDDSSRIKQEDEKIVYYAGLSFRRVEKL